jgi:hypothetical protein
MYVLKCNNKYVADFGYPEPELTENINKAAVWFTKRQIRENASENGFRLGKKYDIVECGLHELKV